MATDLIQPGGFEDVVAAELPGLLRYATALCGDAEQGRDVVQEVLARTYRRWDRISSTKRPGARLMTMVTDEFLSWRRQRAIRSAAASQTATRPGERSDLERTLTTLPRRQQAALVLRYFEGLDYAESAAVLGCAEGTARSACARALATLRLDPDIPPSRGRAHRARITPSETR